MLATVVTGDGSPVVVFLLGGEGGRSQRCDIIHLHAEDRVREGVRGRSWAANVQGVSQWRRVGVHQRMCMHDSAADSSGTHSSSIHADILIPHAPPIIKRLCAHQADILPAESIPSLQARRITILSI